MDDSGVFHMQYDKEEPKNTLYGHLTDQHQEDAPRIQLGKPANVNPCGFENLAVVFREIGKQAGIHLYSNGSRRWLVVVCDGLPYVTGIKVVEKTFK